MKRTILMAITLLALLPDVAKGQWTFDIVSVEAYINDHKNNAACCWPEARWNTATNCCMSTAVRRRANTRK